VRSGSRCGQRRRVGAPACQERLRARICSARDRTVEVAMSHPTTRTEVLAGAPVPAAEAGIATLPRLAGPREGSSDSRGNSTNHQTAPKERRRRETGCIPLLDRRHMSY
jgi:hypothetical protein